MSSAMSLPRLGSAISADVQDKDIEYKSGACYKGQLLDNKKAGYGLFIWPNGARYEGEFDENVRQGKGVAIGEDGSRYEGEFETDVRHGVGKQTWPNGEEYTGDFFKDRRHGKGTYTWPDGSNYTGTFYMDRKEGYGKFTFPDKAAFQGLYKNGEREGPGVLTYTDNTQDVGIWRRECLVKLCSETENAFTMKDHPEFEYDPKDNLKKFCFSDAEDSSMDVFRELIQVPVGLDYAKCDNVLINSGTIFNDGVHRDSLALNKKAFDAAFFKGRKRKSDVNVDTDSYIEVLNTTPTIIQMQKHIYKHKYREKSLPFKVQQILNGDRTDFKEKGKREIASESFIKAAMRGDLNTVQELLDNSQVHPDVADRKGHSALVGAAVNWHKDIINYLLDSGANVNQLNDEGISPLAACHVHFYPIESFKENIAERETTQKPDLIMNHQQGTQTSLTGLTQSTTSKLTANVNDAKSGRSKISMDSGFPRDELTPVETVEILLEQNIADVQNNNENIQDIDVKSQVSGQNQDSDNIADNNEINNDVVQAPLCVENNDDTDSVLESDMGDERKTDVKSEIDEVEERTEFESNVSVKDLEIEVTDNLIERCATQLSSNQLVVLAGRISSNGMDMARMRAVKKADHLLMENVIRLLLQRGADPNASSIPMPVLFFAIKAADVEMTKLLLLKGASTNKALSKEKGGLAPLHIAVGIPGEEGVAITELLLNALAHPDVRATEDDSFLNKQLEEEWSKDVVDETSKARLGGRTPLHIACARDDNHKYACQVVHLLLDHHANSNLLCNGHSPLSLAITSGNDLAIDELLAYGADPSLPLTHGIGNALCTASSTEHEHKRTPAGRIQLIDKLMRAGANILAPIPIGPKRVTGTAVDFAYYMFNMDRRIAHMPYHALTPTERDTYNARRKLLAHLGDLLRLKAVERERYRLIEEEYAGKRSASPSVGFLYTGTGAQPPSGIMKGKGGRRDLQTDSKVSFHATTQDNQGGERPVESKSSKGVTIISPDETQKISQAKRKNKSPIRKPSFKYCYECGRSVGVRLAACSRCKEVYYCSKACKLKAWNARHREECVRIGGKSRSPSPNIKVANRVDSPTPTTTLDGTAPTIKSLTDDKNAQKIKVPLKGRSKSAGELRDKDSKNAAELRDKDGKNAAQLSAKYKQHASASQQKDKNEKDRTSIYDNPKMDNYSYN